MTKNIIKTIDKNLLYQKYIIENKTGTEIAKEMSLAKPTTWKALKYFNIPIRNRSECQKGRFVGEKNGNYKHGKFVKATKYYCKIEECNNEIGRVGFFLGKKLCRKHIALELIEKGKSPIIKLHKKGTTCLAYKDGRCLKKYYCKICNKKISIGAGIYGKQICQKCIKYTRNYYGNKNPNYKHGLKPLKKMIHGLNEYKEWRNQVYKRDNHTCQECSQIGKKLHCHHIKYFSILFIEFLQKYSQFSSIDDKETLVRLAMTYEPFWDISNGKTLCEECHKKYPNFIKNEKI